MKQSLLEAKRYFVENPRRLFVLVFQALLLIAASLLILGDSFLANVIATVAFFSLVIGVALHIIDFIRHNGESGKP